MDSSTVTIVVVSIFALIAIFSFVVYQQRGEAEFKILGMSLKINGSNEKQQPKSSISAKEITSREGGLMAEDNTGQGIEIEKVDVKDDVLLSSNPPTQFKTSHPAPSFPNSLSAQALTAGGNITIQQFVGGQIPLAQQIEYFIQQIGVENIQKSNFANSQFQAYCDVWRSLQGLRVAGDDLWEKVNEENVVSFAERLREARTTVLEGEIFFEDEDREDLIKVLQKFFEFRLGKTRLIRFFSVREIEESESFISKEFFKEVITSEIKHNYDCKLQYEKLLEKIRISFKSRLSNNSA